MQCSTIHKAPLMYYVWSELHNHPVSMMEQGYYSHFIDEETEAWWG